jgi:hypothetical protein
MILAAGYIPSPLRLMLGRHSGIGNRIPRFPICQWPGVGEGIPDSSPDLAWKQGTPDSAGNGNRGPDLAGPGPWISWSEIPATGQDRVIYFEVDDRMPTTGRKAVSESAALDRNQPTVTTTFLT